MAYFRTRFRDGAAVLATYEWQIMHDEEQGSDLRRNVERTAVTSGVGFVRQQGEDSPQLLRFNGTILHSAQLAAMRDYYDACRTRTIFFRDIDGTEYEVLITSFNPQRRRTIKNPRDSAINLHFWDYEIEMEIVA